MSLLYIGTYTGKNSKGIYACRFDAATGGLTSLGLAAEIVNPSFLAVHPNCRFLYAVSEVSDAEGENRGAVSAFSIEVPTGKLILLNRVSSCGRGPCHVVVDPSGRNVLVANYGSGSVAALPVKEDGRLGEASALARHAGSSVHPVRQRAPHAHSVTLSPDNRFALVADLGLDQLLVYRFDPAKGSLAANDPPFARVNPGAGPRHLAFHPNARYVYLINEMQSSVTVFAYDAVRGALHELQTISTLSMDFHGENSAAEVQVDRAGKFLYASNRGHDSVAVFAIAPREGTLTLVEHVSTQGRIPRNFGIDPTGSYLLAANQDSNCLVVFHIAPKSGRLIPSGRVLEVYSPTCVKFVPTDANLTP